MFLILIFLNDWRRFYAVNMTPHVKTAAKLLSDILLSIIASWDPYKIYNVMLDGAFSGFGSGYIMWYIDNNLKKIWHSYKQGYKTERSKFWWFYKISNN